MSKVLIVEDDELVAGLYQVELEARGHEVALRTDEEGGIKEVEGGGYDLVLLDLILPGGSGFKILQTVKADEGAKVVVVTSFGQQENVKKAYDLGADDVLFKVRLTAGEIADKVEQLLS